MVSEGGREQGAGSREQGGEGARGRGGEEARRSRGMGGLQRPKARKVGC